MAQQGKSSFLFLLYTLFVPFDSFHIFDGLTFILYHRHLLFVFLVISYSLTFPILNVNATMHDYNIQYFLLLSSSFYFLFIAGYKFQCFDNLIEHCQKRQGNSSRFFNEYIFHTIRLIPCY